MTNRLISRRSFIGSTGIALAGITTLPAPAALGRPAWSVGCRDVHLKAAGLPDPWQAMKAVGAEAIEVQVNMEMACPNISDARKYSLDSTENIRTLQAALKAQKCRISAFMMANRLDEQLEEEIKWTDKLVKAAVQLGVHTIRIDVVPRKLKEEEFLPFAIKACKQMCELARGTPVRFGIENHGKVTNDPAFLRRLFDGVGSKKLGLTLDTANFYWWGHPERELYAIYEEFAPRAFHTHCKSIRYPEEMRNTKRPMGWEYSKHAAPIYEGDIDMKRVVAILRKAGYKGSLCVENETLGKLPQERQGEVLRKEIALLRDLSR